MSRRRKYHIAGLAEALQEYAKNRTLDLHNYSPYHTRIMDGGYVAVDIWTTGRYFILTTNYSQLTPGRIERSGESGRLPERSLYKFLDEIFYPEANK